MKASNINGRQDRKGKHNDRNFDVDRSSHIDASKSDQNIYWTYNGDDSKTFSELELDFYKDHFSRYVEKQNEKERASAHYKRVKTMEKYRTATYSRPEDKVLQIGDMNDHPSPEQLWECALEYQKRFNERYGSNCKIVDMALHLDEATPHVHVRRVWICHNEDGDERVGQNKALEEMGILPPDTMAPEGRYNNAKVTFTYEDQELFREICREKGLEIEEPEGSKKTHLDVLDYKKQVREEEVMELTKENDKLIKKNDEIEIKNDEAKKSIEEACNAFENLMLNPYFNGRYKRKMEKLRQLEAMERFERLAAIYYAEVLPEIKNADLDALDYIRETGQEKEYNQYKQRKTKAKANEDR